MLLYLWLATICCWLIRLKVVNVFAVAASDADDVVAGAVAAVVAIAVVAFHGDYILLTMLLLLLMRNIYVIFVSWWSDEFYLAGARSLRFVFTFSKINSLNLYSSSFSLTISD